MFDILAEGFKKASSRLQGKTKLNEENISQSLKDLQTSLLEADVEYSIAKNFLNKIKEKSLGTEINLKAGKNRSRMKVSAGDHFVRICKEELTNLMGPEESSLDLGSNLPAIIMMIGLQGTGKTTTSGKLANHLLKHKKRKPLLVAADTYRPAAVEQLKILGERISVPVYFEEKKTPVEICKNSIKHAIKHGLDTVIFDTAGRLTVDDELMSELKLIKQKTKPTHTLLVCDAMMGQDAVTTASAFHDKLDLSGFIMTKLDGDARGGAALSIKEVTGKPIKFLGVGEDLERLEEFRPEGLSSRILGMGDVVGLMDDFEKVADQDTEEDAEKLLSGQFNFKDFYKQISMLQKMGPLKDIMAKLPMQNMLPSNAQVDDQELVKVKAMIDSMTEKERVRPDLMNPSRIKRISRGSGRSLKDINDLLKKFKQMRLMMGKMGKGLMGKIPGLNKLGGQMPSLGDMSQMMPSMAGGGGGSFSSMPKRVDRAKLKKMRKAAKQNRKKNRKR